MIDEKYLRILAAIYYLSHQRPTSAIFPSVQVAETIGVDHDEILPDLRYLQSAGLLTAQWAGTVQALVALTSKGIDYVENPLDTLRTTETSLIQTNTINVGGNFNAIESTIMQMNTSTISEADTNIVRDSYDKVIAQLPPDLVSSQDLQNNREELNAKLRAGDRLGAAAIISGLAKIVSIAKDATVLIQTLPIIYNAIRLLFHLPLSV
jgi:DNA-binding PadR family transcriptional regulator